LKLIKRQESAKLFIESAYKSLEKRIPEATKYQGASTRAINNNNKYKFNIPTGD
jgi:hypothetical protein